MGVVARTEGEQGQALLLALLVLLLVSIALSLLAAAISLHQQAVVGEVRDVQLRAMTDAALARTLAELRRRRTYEGLPGEAFARGHIGSVVEPVSGLQVRVQAAATLGAKQQAVEAQVLVPLQGQPRVLSWRRIEVPEELRRDEPT